MLERATKIHYNAPILDENSFTLYVSPGAAAADHPSKQTWLWTLTKERKNIHIDTEYKNHKNNHYTEGLDTSQQFTVKLGCGKFA